MLPILEQLEARRAALGMPYSVLATRAGLSRNSVYGCLRKGNGRFTTLIAIAHALGTRIVFEADLTAEDMRLEQARDAASRQGCGADGLLARGKTVIWRSEPPNQG